MCGYGIHGVWVGGLAFSRAFVCPLLRGFFEAVKSRGEKEVVGE